MNNNTESPFFTLDAYQSQWALQDDEIEVYTEDDDAPYDMGGVPTVVVVLLVVFFSGLIGAAIFFISYGQERLGWWWCCGEGTEADGKKWNFTHEMCKVHGTD